MFFEIYIKTDWGISLFFLMPLALVAIPALRLPRMALFSITRDLARSHAARRWPHRHASPRARWQAIRTRRDLWRALGARTRTDGGLAPRFFSRWAVVAGTMDMIEPLVFYSPDHPAPFTPGEVWGAG